MPQAMSLLNRALTEQHATMSAIAQDAFLRKHFLVVSLSVTAMTSVDVSQRLPTTMTRSRSIAIATGPRGVYARQ